MKIRKSKQLADRDEAKSIINRPSKQPAVRQVASLPAEVEWRPGVLSQWGAETWQEVDSSPGQAARRPATESSGGNS